MRMKKPWFLLILASLASLAIAPCVAAQTKKSPREPAPRIPEMAGGGKVVYIISKREREVFLQLVSDRERQIFVDAFWKQRDPTPGTTENEYKTEHYRRSATRINGSAGNPPSPAGNGHGPHLHPARGAEVHGKIRERAPDLSTTVWFTTGCRRSACPMPSTSCFSKRAAWGSTSSIRRSGTGR